ncbi:hypothetical protein F5B19DRAFT_467340 [Rostrohypoxylon terebratum]|nr:hypothetical protein F5B19DRAFT_467340 [Rostrohypoxylon terebratum]
MDHQNSAATTLIQATPPPPYTQYLDEGDVDEAAENVGNVERGSGLSGGPGGPREPRQPRGANDAEDVSSQSSKGLPEPHPSIPTPVHTTSAFPTTWGLYRLLSIDRLLMIACHQRGPLFVVSRHSGWWTVHPDIVLHRGPSRALPALAAGVGGVGIGIHSKIMLPPLPGSALVASSEMLWRVQLPAEAGQPLPHVRFRFAIDVGVRAGHLERESFEWRYEESEFIAVFLEGARSGWKLVRLADEEAGSDYDGPQPAPRQEIVAVWAYTKMSLTKILKCRYLGTGASGVFGERWSIMVAMTAMRMYQRQQKNKNKEW